MAIQCHADITPWWVQWQTLTPSPDCNPEEDICSKVDSDAGDHSYLPPQGVCSTFGMMMLVISCICCLAVPTFDIIYVIFLVFDMLCNATYLVSISYMGIMQSHVF